MYSLTAQVTSSLLPFPGVTTDALGEDEITLDSVLHGRFTVGKHFFLRNDLYEFALSILSCDDRSFYTVHIDAALSICKKHFSHYFFPFEALQTVKFLELIYCQFTMNKIHYSDFLLNREY